MTTTWKVIYWVGCIVTLITIIVLLEPNTSPTQWEVRAVKTEGPGTIVTLEPGWEPIGYDRDANIVYIRKKVKK